jgi:hypothetical protein
LCQPHGAADADRLSDQVKAPGDSSGAAQAPAKVDLDVHKPPLIFIVVRISSVYGSAPAGVTAATAGGNCPCASAGRAATN